MLERILHAGEEIAIPGRFVAEWFPVLRHLPSWLPGVDFKRFATKARRDVVSTMDKLFKEGVEKMVELLSYRSRTVYIDMDHYRTPTRRRTFWSLAFLIGLVLTTQKNRWANSLELMQ